MGVATKLLQMYVCAWLLRVSFVATKLLQMYVCAWLICIKTTACNCCISVCLVAVCQFCCNKTAADVCVCLVAACQFCCNKTAADECVSLCVSVCKNLYTYLRICIFF